MYVVYNVYSGKKYGYNCRKVNLPVPPSVDYRLEVWKQAQLKAR